MGPENVPRTGLRRFEQCLQDYPNRLRVIVDHENIAHLHCYSFLLHYFCRTIYILLPKLECATLSSRANGFKT